MCPDKDNTKSHKDAVTMPDGRFPNKEKLHVPGITRDAYPSLLFYIMSRGFSFLREK